MDPSKNSERFNAGDADITFISSDNVLFRLHKQNLALNSRGFPPADTPSDDEPVALSESASTLEILFQYVYCERFPDLDHLNFKDLMLLAKAAEKYGIVSAMKCCQYEIKSRNIDESDAMDVFCFAAEHDYPHLLTKVSALVVGRPLSEIAGILPLNLFVRWSEYRESFVRARLRHIVSCAPHPSHACTTAWPSLDISMTRLSLDTSGLLTSLPSQWQSLLQNVFASARNEYTLHCCRNQINSWENMLKSRALKDPSFDSNV